MPNSTAFVDDVEVFAGQAAAHTNVKQLYPPIEIVIEQEKPRIQFIRKPFYDFVKRIADIILSALGMVFLSPVFLLIAVLIKAEDKGPVFFAQDRTGRNGKVFKMYKFRSMRVNAEKQRNDLLNQNEADGPLFKIQKDPRITKIGGFIRKTSIDELPQFLNIFKGDMTIIGPRPFVTYEQEQFDEYQSQRLLVKPGLTCYWQTNGRSDCPFEKMIEYDLDYVRNRSFKVDIKLFFKTIKVVFKCIGAR